MDPELTKEIAKQLVQYLPTYSWGFLAVQFFITIVAAGAGAFLGEYLKTRGQHLATKADFDSLQTQLRANTELVETVKAEVNQKDLVKREWRNIRCLKIEQLLMKLGECEDHLTQLLHDALDRKLLQVGNPLDEFKMIASLYLSELNTPVGAYIMAFHKHRLDVLQFRGEVFQIPQGVLLPQSLLDKHDSMLETNWPPILDAQRELTSAAASLLRKIMEVA